MTASAIVADRNVQAATGLLLDSKIRVTFAVMEGLYAANGAIIVGSDPADQTPTGVSTTGGGGTPGGALQSAQANTNAIEKNARRVPGV
ncbi:hypothetical protein [Marinobacterium arenosum]|uniref:hypothetical protein n=1 Tax=Marinobacterium arenosum TaxID=2862496 RepID=UPI001C95BA08|nr:hypothetical protein [Marinobacterium arenosum]MBY4677476.1 hypothetical protein [Marinobacterium arenosum]